MRISRKRRPQKPLIPIYYINDRIRAPEVRLLDAGGENLGVMPTAQALQRAREMELDLVEINPKAEPPVCQLIEYARFKYQKEKEAKKQKANAHVSEIKGIRLSVRIGEHDMEVRQAQAENFLERGDKIKPEIILRGRENARPEMAFEVIADFYQRINAKYPIRYEQEPKRMGNKVGAVIART